jgi:hypothetical protein
MSPRRTRLATLIAGVAAFCATLVHAGTANATSLPTTRLVCGNFVVASNTPSVTASQAFRGSNGVARYEAELLYYNPSRGQWVTAAVLGPFVAQVMSNDFNLGGTTGYAGPTWYRSNGSAVTSVRFNLTRHGYYAIRNWTIDPVAINATNAPWTSAYAITAGRSTYCYA